MKRGAGRDVDVGAVRDKEVVRHRPATTEHVDVVDANDATRIEHAAAGGEVQGYVGTCFAPDLSAAETSAAFLDNGGRGVPSDIYLGLRTTRPDDTKVVDH